MRLQLSPDIEPRTRRVVLQTLEQLPRLRGDDISLAIEPQLSACAGKLVSGFPQRGTPVHAAAFIRRRQIVLESALLRDTRTFRLILVHELFHFVWARFGNPSREAFAVMLSGELDRGARGELGESAGVKKAAFRLSDRGERRALWRDYVCESFCDTAAWLYSGTKIHSEFRLAKRWRDARLRWFRVTFDKPCNC